MTETAAEIQTSVLDAAELRAAGSPLLSPQLVDERHRLALQNAGRWLRVLQAALGHRPYLITARRRGAICGFLPLAFVKSALFGRFLVSLPYVNSAGVVANEQSVADLLVNEAVNLARQLNVRYLELRQESELSHPSLADKNDSKVLMRLKLPATNDALWDSFKSKLRSQIKSGQKHEFATRWGGQELLADFYNVFSQNMRDLGTPVYSPRLFSEILREFAGEAELCVLYKGDAAVAGALLVHGAGMSEVPSASSLRAYNASNPNMVMYWNLLCRAIERGQTTFDFGRSTLDSGTFKFKSQWGAQPSPSIWQYHLRHGSAADMRPTNSKFSLAIKVWQKLPVSVTRLIGPMIVRGIP